VPKASRTIANCKMTHGAPALLGGVPADGGIGNHNTCPLCRLPMPAFAGAWCNQLRR